MPSSRVFVDGSSQSLSVDATPITAAPLSISAWFKADVLQADDILVSIPDKDVADQFFALGIGWDDFGAQGANSVLQAIVRNGSRVYAQTSTSYTALTWHHACAVFATTTDRRVFLDGGGKGTNTTGLTPANVDRIAIGVLGDSTPTDYMDGKIALVVLRNVALSDAEVAEEAAETTLAGILDIQTAAIVAYWLNGTESDDDHDTGTYDMTANNGPTWDSADWPLPVPATGNIIPIIDHHNRMMVMMGD